ncbi:MAG: preprotein translocase subunit SecE [Muribaculaceae bacterium]
MKKLKLITDIQESYSELVYKVSWPTKSQLVNSSVVVMIASIIISLIILVMDQVIDHIMHFIYGLGV